MTPRSKLTRPVSFDPPFQTSRTSTLRPFKTNWVSMWTVFVAKKKILPRRSTLGLQMTKCIHMYLNRFWEMCQNWLGQSVLTPPPSNFKNKNFKTFLNELNVNVDDICWKKWYCKKKKKKKIEKKNCNIFFKKKKKSFDASLQTSRISTLGLQLTKCMHICMHLCFWTCLGRCVILG